MLEAPGLWADHSEADRHRPADVLVMPHLALARVLPDGSCAVRTERVCLDFAVINALGSTHWADTSAEGGRACESYDAAKRTRNRAEARCAERGLTLWPVVFEQQGGTSRRADAAIRGVARAVGDREARDEATVRREMRHRVAVAISSRRSDLPERMGVAAAVLSGDLAGEMCD